MSRKPRYNFSNANESWFTVIDTVYLDWQSVKLQYIHVVITENKHDKI